LRRARYTQHDFDFAVLVILDEAVYYIMPVHVFTSYRSGISLVESGKRQRRPRSAEYRERWDLLAPQVLESLVSVSSAQV
jgi:hypothetical protein